MEYIEACDSSIDVKLVPGVHTIGVVGQYCMRRLNIIRQRDELQCISAGVEVYLGMIA